MSLTASRRQGGNGLSGVTDRTFDGLSSLANQVDSQPGYGELSNSLASSQAAIAADPAYGELANSLGVSLSAMQPSLTSGPDYSFLSNTLGGALDGLVGLSRDAYGNSAMGMDQFYGNQLMPTDYSPLMDRLDSSYQSAVQQAAGRGGDSNLFGRSDYGGYANAIGGGFDASSGMLGALADRGFSSIDSNQYRDGDLLAGLYSGYGDTLGAADRAAERGAGALSQATGLLQGGFGSTIGALGQGGGQQAAPSVSGSLLSGLGEKEDPQKKDPLTRYADNYYRRQLGMNGYQMLPGTKAYNPDVRRELDIWRAAAGY